MSERWKKTWYYGNLFASSAQRTIDPKFRILRLIWLIGQLEIWNLSPIWNSICFMKALLIANTSAKKTKKENEKNSWNTLDHSSYIWFKDHFKMWPIFKMHILSQKPATWFHVSVTCPGFHVISWMYLTVRVGFRCWGIICLFSYHKWILPIYSYVVQKCNFLPLSQWQVEVPA